MKPHKFKKHWFTLWDPGWKCSVCGIIWSFKGEPPSDIQLEKYDMEVDCDVEKLRGIMES